jgi:hypothetical protein
LERLSAAYGVAERGVERWADSDSNGPRPRRVMDCWASWGLIVGEMEGTATVFSLFAPELAGFFWACYFGTDIAMYLSCWD